MKLSKVALCGLVLAGLLAGCTRSGVPEPPVGAPAAELPSSTAPDSFRLTAEEDAPPRILNVSSVPETLSAGSTARFDPVVLGEVTNWEWKFNGPVQPQSSSEGSPILSLEIAGEVAGWVVASNEYGVSNQYQFSFEIQQPAGSAPHILELRVNGEKLSDFPVGHSGDEVRFSAITSAPAMEWEWDFGDGAVPRISRNSVAAVRLTSSSVFPLTLHAANQYGEDESMRNSYRIDSVPSLPFPKLSTPMSVSVCKGAPTFFAVMNHDSLGTRWEFGTGAEVIRANESSAAVVFNEAGSRTSWVQHFVGEEVSRWHPIEIEVTDGTTLCVEAFNIPEISWSSQIHEVNSLPVIVMRSSVVGGRIPFPETPDDWWEVSLDIRGYPRVLDLHGHLAVFDSWRSQQIHSFISDEPLSNNTPSFSHHVVSTTHRLDGLPTSTSNPTFLANFKDEFDNLHRGVYVSSSPVPSETADWKYSDLNWIGEGTQVFSLDEIAQTEESTVILGGRSYREDREWNNILVRFDDWDIDQPAEIYQPGQWDESQVFNLRGHANKVYFFEYQYSSDQQVMAVSRTAQPGLEDWNYGELFLPVNDPEQAFNQSKAHVYLIQSSRNLYWHFRDVTTEPKEVRIAGPIEFIDGRFVSGPPIEFPMGISGLQIAFVEEKPVWNTDGYFNVLR